MEQNWRDVMLLVEGFLKEAGPTVAALRRRLKDLPPGMGYGQVYYNPKTHRVWVSVGDWEEDLDAWREPLEAVPGVCHVHIEAESGPPGHREDDSPWILVKKGYSPTLRAIGQLAGWVPGPTNAWYGGPSPLAATLSGGLLGAGVGYGAGLLGEQFLPEEHFQPGRLRRVLALLGGGLGAAPALWWGAISHRHHPSTPGLQAWGSSWPFRPEDMRGQGQGPPPEPELPQDYLNPKYDNTPPVKLACAAARELLEEFEVPAHYKQALGEIGDDYGVGGLINVPIIHADQFTQTVWQDPFTPVPIRAATTGLVDSASAIRGGARTVSPMDVTRIAVGMGSGYASGAFVGKALGALAGLRPESQKKLQQAGVWAGFLSNVVPLAFPG